MRRPDPVDVQIRAPREDDRFADGVPAPRPGQDSWRRTRVAVADGQCVGVASLTLSPVTDTYVCEVDVAPDYRRRRIGTRLYAAVHETANPPFPVLARAMQSRPLRRQFADSLGCTVLFHCPEPWIDPTSGAGRQWADEQPLPSGSALVTLGELPTAQVGEAWARCFEWTHRTFGTVHPERLADVWLGMSGELDPDTSMLTVEVSTGAITALSLVIPDAWDGRTMIISETVRKDQPDGDRLLRAVVAGSLRVLGQRGVQRVELEGHATDAHLPGLVQSLPPGGGDPMDVLRLDPPRPSPEK